MATTFELVRLIVQPVVLVREDGKIVDERDSPPSSLFNAEQMVEYYEGLVAELEKHNAEQADG